MSTRRARAPWAGPDLVLSIVKHAVEQMGGSIQVDSRLGEGSEFTVELPYSLTLEAAESL